MLRSYRLHRGPALTSRQNRAPATAAKKKDAGAKRAAAHARKVAKLEAALAKIRYGTPPPVDLDGLDLFKRDVSMT